jgi:hypothetical protein
MFKNLFFVIVSVLCFNQVYADQLGEVTEVQAGTDNFKFYIGEIPVKVGEILQVRNSTGQKDLRIQVTAVSGPYAQGEVISAYYSTVGLEKMHKGRIVVLDIDPNEISEMYFYVGPSFSQRVGDFGGTNYGLGLGFNGPLSYRKDLNLRWSLVLQADDLGKDSDENGKRVSYYMFGVGRKTERLQYFLHLGMADNMTMPKDGTTVNDPYTGAPYPDNVQHKNKFGYLLMLRYPFVMTPITRNKLTGWSIGPFATVGGSIGSNAYKNTITAGVSFDLTGLW